jgi:hypothetical protein
MHCTASSCDMHDMFMYRDYDRMLTLHHKRKTERLLHHSISRMCMILLSSMNLSKSVQPAVQYLRLSYTGDDRGLNIGDNFGSSGSGCLRALEHNVTAISIVIITTVSPQPLSKQIRACSGPTDGYNRLMPSEPVDLSDCHGNPNSNQNMRLY